MQLIVTIISVVYGVVTGCKIIVVMHTVHKEVSGRTAVIMKSISLLERLLCAIDSVLAMFGNDTLCNCDR